MLSDLPFKAEDLKPGERYYRGKKTHGGGDQALGYDLGAKRLDSKTDKWTSHIAGKDTSKNDSYVVYGKPVYAMSGGTVVRGWRNAPENPKPGESHAELGKGIGGGGNNIVLEHSDGSRVLYAHFQPGTVPKKLVPHEAVLLPGDDPDAQDIPKSQQVEVSAGDLLGRVGNSGSSSGPHLHVHRVKDGNAADLTFRRGLASRLTDGKADINDWERFAGERIPAGPVLIWPPRTMTGEYARHGFPIGTYNRMFAHLADSGFAPNWIDGYNVAGKVFLNFIFTPAKGAFRSFHGLSASGYQARFDEAAKDGYQPVFVESYVQEGGVRYIVIFEKGKSGKFRARHGIDDAQHQAEFESARKAGFSPSCVSVVSVGGKRRYTVLYRSDSIGSWQLKSRIKHSDYQAEFDANNAAGRRPVYQQAYKHGADVFYSTVFASDGGGAFRASHGLTGSQYQTAYDANTTKGFGTEVVTGVDGASSQHRFAGVWLKR